ncbi:MAG: response regulator transcription factor [Bacteroidota bacterium]
MKILICEDQETYRHGIIDDINKGLPGRNIIHEAANGDQAKEYLSQQSYDIVLMDIKLPGKSGMEWLQFIKIKWPDQAVIMLSNYEETDFAFTAYKYGASGFLNKAVSTRELIQAILKGAGGGTCFSQQIEQMIQDAKKTRKKSHAEFNHPLLSDHQIKFMKMWVMGRTSNEIALQLKIHPKSVSSQKSKIKNLMGFKSDSEMYSYYEKNLRKLSP